MRKQIFSEVYRAKDVDTEALLRELGIRNCLMQLTRLSKPGIVDENVNFHILFFNSTNNFLNVLFGSHIKVHAFHPIIQIERLPLLRCDY